MYGTSLTAMLSEELNAIANDELAAQLERASAAQLANCERHADVELAKLETNETFDRVFFRKARC